MQSVFKELINLWLLLYMLKITWTKHSYLALPWKNWVMKNNFHIMVQSNNVVCDGFDHVRFCWFWDRVFNFFCKPQQRYFDLYLKNKLLKKINLKSLTLTLYLLFFLEPWPDIVCRKIAAVFSCVWQCLNWI